MTGASECKQVVNDRKRLILVTSQGSVFLKQDVKKVRMYFRWHKEHINFRELSGGCFLLLLLYSTSDLHTVLHLGLNR